MCRFVHAGSAAALLLCLEACASVPPPPPVVMLGKEDITVAGRRVHTVDEMLAVLSEEHIASVALRTQPDVPYERVGAVIYSIFRAGRKVSEVDGAAAP
ncbi:hypothetical protein O3299_05080 [Janthinobacterium sp. SUN176]|uniref:hypothetical protein n=1 Tax=Janthinobacterium sp. SUN176 TaxID=3014788 RepID=UPI0027132C1A|nr:hypothetical protein [Janthinobacterium sp. SUN176]MDO8070886.1 hypothetical protein [Janthinobacterium sp. SUN176]